MTARSLPSSKLFTHPRSTSSLPRVEIWAIVLVTVLSFFPAWLRGGTHADWTWPLPWLAIGGLSGWLFAFARRCSGQASECADEHALIAWRDPAIWLGFFFVLFILVQWWNAGRVLYYDAGTRVWAYSPPRHPAFPSAITSVEARQMLDWFIPAWVILLVLRSPVMSARGVRAIWRILVINAGLMAVFGLVQFASGTTNMYWRVPMRPHFFAAFGYPNHAGSYFLMTECLAAGLLIYEFDNAGGKIRRGRVAALAAGFLLSLLGANFALSRASIILGWALLLPVGYFMARTFGSRLRPVQRVNLASVSVAILSLAVLLTVGLGRDAIRMEFKPENDQKTFLDRETNFRWFQLQTAFHVWRDYPWYGVGGWGYRYLMAHYLPPEQWRRVTEGKANVHNDPLQFLTEFGVLGAGAMGGVALALVCSALRRRTGYPALFIFPALGIGLVSLQSLIDLPFRSPAVLYLWLIMLAGLNRVRILRRDPAQIS